MCELYNKNFSVIMEGEKNTKNDSIFLSEIEKFSSQNFNEQNKKFLSDGLDKQCSGNYTILGFVSADLPFAITLKTKTYYNSDSDSDSQEVILIKEINIPTCKYQKLASMCIVYSLGIKHRNSMTNWVFPSNKKIHIDNFISSEIEQINYQSHETYNPDDFFQIMLHPEVSKMPKDEILKLVYNFNNLFLYSAFKKIGFDLSNLNKIIENGISYNNKLMEDRILSLMYELTQNSEGSQFVTEQINQTYNYQLTNILNDIKKTSSDQTQKIYDNYKKYKQKQFSDMIRYIFGNYRSQFMQKIGSRRERE
jgi:hypothetical protein